MAGESCPYQGGHLAEFLEYQRISGDITDFIVVCEGTEFNAHKTILHANSPYFEAMLKPEWRANNGRMELPSVTEEEMGVILPFLYTGKVKEVNDPELIMKLFKTSDMMQIDGLFQYCYKKLCNDLSCDNFLEIYNLACLCHHSGLTDQVVAFLAKHFVNISGSEEFKHLSPDQILKVVQKVAINDDIIEVLLQWAEAEEDREGSLLHILTSVGLQNVTTRCLMQLISERTLVLRNLHILTLLTAKATARIYFENVIVDKLICCGSVGGRHVCRMFDIRQNRWWAPKILPFNLEQGMTTASFGEHVYFVGGDYTSVSTRVNLSYQPSTNATPFYKLSSRVNPSYKPPTQVTPSYKPSTQVIKYNPALNIVVSEGKLSVPVSNTRLGVLLSSIYVVNGENHNGESVRTVQRYNPATNTCEEVAQTNKAHFRPAVLSFSNYLYVIGSWSGETSVERYDHETDAWTIITNIPGRVYWCSATILKKRLFVSPSYNSHELQVYDFTSNAWATMKIEGLTEIILGLYSTTLDGKPILMIRDNRNVVHFYDDETKELLRQSTVNQEPWDSHTTCVI